MAVVIRVTVSGIQFGQLVQNVLHFVDANGLTPLADVCADVRDHWVANVKKRQTQAIHYVNVTAQSISPLGLGVNLPINMTGDASAGWDQQDPVVCAILKIQTAVPGKTGRGRVYLAAPEFGMFNQGILTAGSLAFWESDILAPIRSRFLVSGTSPTILAVVPKANPNDYKLATELNLKTISGSQRRRQIGFGA